MANTDVSICSRALVQLGARPISALDASEGDAALTCLTVYPGLRAELMVKAGWRHLMKKKDLTEDTEAPVGEWEKSFVIPGDAIAGLPHAVFSSGGDTISQHDFEVFGQRIYTNFATLQADYMIDKPESEWPEFFVSMVVKCLCAEIAFAITDQQNVAENWFLRAYGTPQDDGLGGAVGDAMAVNAQASGNIGIESNAFVDARFGSGV